MDVSIITGIISGVIAIAVCLINNHYQRIDSDKKHEANIMLISYRLEQLEKEVARHNNVVARTYDLERHQEVLDEQIKVANHRITDLEKGDDGR